MIKTIYKLCSLFILACLAALAFLYVMVFVKIDAGGYPKIVTVENGETLTSIARKLHEEKIITNEFVFKAFVRVLDKDSDIKQGEYTFKGPLNLVEITSKLVNGLFEYIPVTLTIREGEDSRDITHFLYTNFKNISSAYTEEDLLKVMQAKEGYLFPETYLYPPFATLDDVFAKIDPEFVDRIKKYNIPTEDLTRVLTIASILEKEVPHPEDMKIVAGIINNRLQKGMPLQMDSTLDYLTGKASLELTMADLQIDSPYNTYKVKGLPTGPIGNPGDIAIDAALNPDKNEYLYFLSDKDGINHYAVTYEEHLKNRKEFLGK